MTAKSSPELTPLQRAIVIAGGTTALARALGIKSQAVSQWKRSSVPAKRAIEIERATGGKVKRHQLRPDFFGSAA